MTSTIEVRLPDFVSDVVTGIEPEVGNGQPIAHTDLTINVGTVAIGPLTREDTWRLAQTQGENAAPTPAPKLQKQEREQEAKQEAEPAAPQAQEPLDDRYKPNEWDVMTGTQRVASLAERKEGPLHTYTCAQVSTWAANRIKREADRLENPVARNNALRRAGLL